VAPIARGGFGAVYVAEQLTTERRVALKVLARYDAQLPVDRLLAEARVTSRIESDHIVQVIDAGVDAESGDVFVVMELLRGMTLDDHLTAHGALPAPEVAEYLRQIAIGLDKAHGHLNRSGRPTPIVHRDLKPSNIFLTTRDDGQPLLKILDFGAAKVLSHSAKASGMIHGTPQFMASEQALGDPSSAVTDIWAFGLIAFNLLTGHSYWLTVHRDGTQAQLFAEILSLRLVPASQRIRELGLTLQLPPSFDAWFARCVNRDPAQRFANAGLAAGELSQLLGVKTPRISTPPRRPLPASPAPASPHVDNAQQLETVAALSRTPPLRHRSHTRAGLPLLALALAGAAGVILWRTAPVTAPPPQPISTNATPSSSTSQPPTTHAPQAPNSPITAPSTAPPIAPQSSAQPPSKAPATATSATSAKRAPSPTRPSAPLKIAKPARDPYEQR